MLLVIAMVAAGALVIVGVGRLRQGPSLTAREQALSAKVLQASDLPKGWSVVPPTTDLPSTTLACLGAADNVGAGVPLAARGFRSPTGVPSLVEVLEGYSEAGAVRRFDQVTSQLFHGCPGAGAGTTSSGLGQTQIVVMPRVGDESAAVSTPTADGTVTTVVVARIGGTIAYLVYETHGPPDPSLLQLAAIRATAKIGATR